MSNKNTLFEELVKFKHKGEETVILEKKKKITAFQFYIYHVFGKNVAILILFVELYDMLL